MNSEERAFTLCVLIIATSITICYVASSISTYGLIKSGHKQVWKAEGRHYVWEKVND